MNLKQLVILVVLMAVLGGAGLAIYKKQNKSWETTETAAGQNVLGNFPINDVTHVSISHGTDEVNLVKKDDLWRVSERANYPANYSLLSGLLIKLRDLKVVQSEVVGPSQLARLNLAPGQGTNSPTTIEFKGKDDKPLDTLLLGKQHFKKPTQPSGPEGEGGWPDGRYVKVGNSKNVALISDAMEGVEPNPANWVDKDFFHIEKPKSIQVLFPASTNSWKLTRETESGEWKLADAKPGEQLDSSKAQGVSNPFSSPSFTDVYAGDTMNGTGTSQPTQVNVETFDHFDYKVRIGPKTNEDYLVTMKVSAEIPQERAAGKDEKPADKTKLDKEFSDNRQKLEDKLKKEEAFQSWTYLVPGWSVDSLIKERSQLMAEKKAESKDGGVTSTNSLGSAESPADLIPPLNAAQSNP